MWRVVGRERGTGKIVWATNVPHGMIPRDYDRNETYPVQWEDGTGKLEYFLEHMEEGDRAEDN